MALPRRCTYCKCYVANWLTHCPRCNKLAPAIIQSNGGKPTLEEREEERTTRDAKLPRIHGKKMQWKPSLFSIDQQRLMLDEVRERIERSETPEMRNALRSELRLIKATLAKAERTHCWTYETHPSKHENFFIYISPKGRRYVLSTRDGPADLIIENKRGAAFPITRLQRFENSRYARVLKEHAEETHANVQRKKAKKQRLDAHSNQNTLSLGESKHGTPQRKRARRNSKSAAHSRTNARTRT